MLPGTEHVLGTSSNLALLAVCFLLRFRRGIRNAVLETEPQKPREGHAVVHVILGLLSEKL
jgi:hypothetical protein